MPQFLHDCNFSLDLVEGCLILTESRLLELGSFHDLHRKHSLLRILAIHYLLHFPISSFSERPQLDVLVDNLLAFFDSSENRICSHIH